MFSFTIFGTAAGLPTLARGASGIGVSIEGDRRWILVDAGEATQLRIFASPLSYQDIALIAITHAHGDHCYGVPGLLATMGMHQRKKPLVVWAPESVIEWLQTTIRLTDLYLPFPVEFLATETVEHFDFSETLTLSTVELRHRVPSHAFAFDATSEKRHLDPAKLAALGVPQGKLWRKLQNGVAIECGGKSISPDEAGFLETRRCRAVVGGDNADPALIAPVSKGLDVLMHEATYSQAVAEKVGEAPMHSSVAAVAKFAESAGIPNLVLTHFSARHHAPAAMAALEAEAKQFYSGTLFMAEDGMRLRLNEKKVLEKL